MPKKKCAICKKRLVSQQEWKKSREKDLCFTCYILEQNVNAAMRSLVAYADNKGVALSYQISLMPKGSSLVISKEGV